MFLSEEYFRELSAKNFFLLKIITEKKLKISLYANNFYMQIIHESNLKIEKHFKNK